MSSDVGELTAALQKLDMQQAKQRAAFIAAHIRSEAEKMFAKQNEENKKAQKELASLNAQIKAKEAELELLEKKMDGVECMYVIKEDDIQGGGPYDYTYIIASTRQQAEDWAAAHCSFYEVKRLDYHDIRQIESN